MSLGNQWNCRRRNLTGWASHIEGKSPGQIEVHVGYAKISYIAIEMQQHFEWNQLLHSFEFLSDLSVMTLSNFHLSPGVSSTSPPSNNIIVNCGSPRWWKLKQIFHDLVRENSRNMARCFVQLLLEEPKLPVDHLGFSELAKIRKNSGAQNREAAITINSLISQSSTLIGIRSTTLSDNWYHFLYEQFLQNNQFSIFFFPLAVLG